LRILFCPPRGSRNFSFISLWRNLGLKPSFHIIGGMSQSGVRRGGSLATMGAAGLARHPAAAPRPASRRAPFFGFHAGGQARVFGFGAKREFDMHGIGGPSIGFPKSFSRARSVASRPPA
jgi:hypothetical protein